MTRGAPAALSDPGCLFDGEPLPESFYARDAEQVARDLLGAVLISQVDATPCAAQIVEAEAYVGPHDPASHGAERIGRTTRNRALFGPPGRAYVYRSYGIHWCLNAVSASDGYPSGVLLRAARPLAGDDAIAARRPGREPREWLRGPGNLARGLGVTADLNGHPLDHVPLHILRGERVADACVRRGPRVGVSRAADWPLRFWVAESPWVSRRV